MRLQIRTIEQGKHDLLLSDTEGVWTILGDEAYVNVVYTKKAEWIYLKITLSSAN